MGDEDVDAVKLTHAVSRLVGTTVRAAKAAAAASKVGRTRERSQLVELLEALGGAKHGASPREPVGPS
jgi:hypothetical protein